MAGVGAKDAGRGDGHAARLSWQSRGQGFESPQLHGKSGEMRDDVDVGGQRVDRPPGQVDGLGATECGR